MLVFVDFPDAPVSKGIEEIGVAGRRYAPRPAGRLLSRGT